MLRMSVIKSCAAMWWLLLCSMAPLGEGKTPPSPEQGPQYLNMVTFKQGAGLPGGDLLVTDAFSLYSKGKKISNGACKELAMRLQGANAWAFCGAKGGCGSGCAAYTKANPPLPINKSPVGKAYWARSLPLKGAGYWTYPKPGLKGCALDAKGKLTDKWAFGTCCILKVADAKKPKLQSKAAGAGWQHTTIIRDKKCGNLLSSTCAACMTSTNPLSCLACSKGFYVQPAKALQAMLAPNLEVQSAQQAACVRCAAMPYGPTTARCIQCVAKRKPCNRCAITIWSPEQKAPKLPDLATCIDCAWDNNLANIDPTPYLLKSPGVKLRSSVCRECASRPPAQRRQCSSCMATFATKLCPHYNLTDPSFAAYFGEFGSCQSAADTLAKCDKAFKTSGPTFSQCVKLGRAARCLDCLAWNNVAGRCMACVVKRNQYCDLCISGTEGNPDYSVNDSCEACLVDATVREKSLCGTCNRVTKSYYDDTSYIDTVFCNKCIRDPATTDFSGCPWGTDTPPDGY